MYAEARGESEAGQKKVVHVVLNRVANNRFPSTVYNVVHQRARNRWGGWTYQFTPLSDGSFFTANPTDEHFGTVDTAIEMWINDNDLTDGALFFQRYSYPIKGWHEQTTVVYGNHRFLR